MTLSARKVLDAAMSEAERVTVLPVILGLDPSPHRCGWGVVRLDDGAPVACGCVEIRHANKDGWRVGFDRAVRDAVAVIAKASDTFYTVVREHEVSAVYVERPSGGRNYQGTLDIAWVSGQVAQAAGRRFGVDVWCLRPQEWKSAVGLAGNASKEAVLLRAIDLGFDAYNAGGLDPVITQDAADAGLIARAGWIELDRAAERSQT